MMRNPLLKKYRCVGLGQLCSWENDLGAPSFCVCPRVLERSQRGSYLAFPASSFWLLAASDQKLEACAGGFLCAYSMDEKLGGALGMRVFIAHNIEMFAILEIVQPISVKSCDSHVILSHQCHHVGWSSRENTIHRHCGGTSQEGYNRSCTRRHSQAGHPAVQF